tara:strand:- start:182 stop:388 length:207 start_codon:yes stop_codon:yes gene_type:complete
MTDKLKDKQKKRLERMQKTQKEYLQSLLKAERVKRTKKLMTPLSEKLKTRITSRFKAAKKNGKNGKKR